MDKNKKQIIELRERLKRQHGIDLNNFRMNKENYEHSPEFNDEFLEMAHSQFEETNPALVKLMERVQNK